MRRNQAWIDAIEHEEGESLRDIIDRERKFGATQRDIALSLGVTHAQLVYAMRHNLDMPKIKDAPYDVVMAVRNEHSGRGSCAALARKYKQPIGTIRNWIAGRSRVSA